MFKLEFPAENKTLAAAIGRALLEYGTSKVELPANAPALAAHQLPANAVEQHVADPAPEDIAAQYAESNTEPTLDEAAVADLGNCSPAQSTAEQGAGGAQGATDAKLDLHGVPFDADYCANAADPYYKTGKTAGQWKKKKGVDQDEYDDWYAVAKPAASASTSTAAEDTPIDTTAAFSGQKQQAPANAGAPADAGAFMVWVSEMTTAGHFTQADVTAAYGVVGIGAADIFQGENAVQNIASLHGVLSAKVPA